MADPAPLTERQEKVLALFREGKNPTEIGKAMGISSQGVHGHLRRLANRGLIELDRPARAKGGKVPNGRIDPDAALDAVRRAAEEQRALVAARMEAIDGEIATLRAEKNELKKTLDKLEAHLADR